jgi:hypothetical protein
MAAYVLRKVPASPPLVEVSGPQACIDSRRRRSYAGGIARSHVELGQVVIKKHALLRHSMVYARYQCRPADPQNGGLGGDICGYRAFWHCLLPTEDQYVPCILIVGLSSPSFRAAALERAPSAHSPHFSGVESLGWRLIKFCCAVADVEITHVAAPIPEGRAVPVALCLSPRGDVAIFPTVVIRARLNSSAHVFGVAAANRVTFAGLCVPVSSEAKGDDCGDQRAEIENLH